MIELVTMKANGGMGGHGGQRCMGTNGGLTFMVHIGGQWLYGRHRRPMLVTMITEWKYKDIIIA